MNGWQWAILAAVLALAAAPAAVNAQRSVTMGAVIEMGCGGGAAVCRTSALEALQMGATVQRAILVGCQNQFSRTAATADKRLASACMLRSVNVAAGMLSDAQLLDGQHVLKSSAMGKTSSLPVLAGLLRSRLLSITDECSRIGHLYTRYNCIATKLHNVGQAP